MPGSGKSSTGKALSTLLGYERYSSGDFFREMAAKRGITVEEINTQAEHDTAIDHKTDAWIKEKRTRENLIIDSRLAFHWIPDAFKVFLKLDPQIAAERTFAHIKSEGRVGQDAVSIDDAYEKMLARIESERKRYEALYGLDYTNESNYNLVVDTGSSDLPTVTKTVAEAYTRWLGEPV